MKKSIARILFVFMMLTIGTLGLMEFFFRILIESAKWLLGKEFNEDIEEYSVCLNLLYDYAEKYI